MYPKDVKLRAKCIQRLFFNSSLYSRVRDCNVHVFYQGGKEIPRDKIDQIIAVYDTLETFLASDPFLVTDRVTIADICCAVTVLTLDVFGPIQQRKHPKILAWIQRVREATPVFDEINTRALNDFRTLVDGTMENNKTKF